MLKRRYHLILLIIIIIIAVFAFVSINQMAHQEGNTTNNSSGITREIIGNDSSGSVEVIRNIGNPNAKKIAYVIGVHPLENDTHKILLKLLPTVNNLNYSYDIYIINVSENFSSYGQLHPDDQPGRQTGQELALKYVYPKIVNGSYVFVIDVHAHGGAYGEYNTFVFCPVEGSSGEAYAKHISQSSNNLSFYNPNHTTSGPYLTVPLNQKGIPAIYLEENSYIQENIKELHVLELIHIVDNMKF